MGTAIGDILEKEDISLNDLKGRRLGFDSYNVLYQFLSSIRSYDGTPLMDAKGNVTSHLTGLLYRTTNLLEKGIKPVFVFDGEPHPLKKKVLEERKRIRTEAIAEHEKALKEGDLETAKKLGGRALKLTREMVAEAKELVSALGLPVVDAPGEGEAQIACMVSAGKLEGCVSQDYDALLFGASTVYRNIAVSGKRKIPGKSIYAEVSPERISLKANLERMGITRQQLIWVGMLVGTDFNEKVPRIGPKTALKLVKEHDSFEGILGTTGFEPGFDYKAVEKIFLEPQHTETFSLEFHPPDPEAVKRILCNEHNFSRERVENALAKIRQKAEEKGEQSSLSHWG